MCLSPITIKNRSKYFSLSTLHKVEMTVPCGQCAECLAAKQNEYYFRSYYQAIETWDKGGYCLFDTLTYDNDHVPHINDYIEDSSLKFPDDLNFTCFCMEDVRLFLVRLRRSLSYHGFDVKHKLKYFICSEYGEDPRYTHRPHYHVMFYVTDPFLDPITLSKYIDKNWAKGMTDGEPYKGSQYVLHKRVFYNEPGNLHMQNVCHYIGKYMTKDSEFTKVVNERLVLIEKWIRAKQISEMYLDQYADWEPVDLFTSIFVGDMFVGKMKKLKKSELTESNKKYLKDLKRQCSQFIRQSQGFGLYMIEKLGKDWIFEHNCVRMPDSKYIWKEIPIPGYIMTKLFKEKKVQYSVDSEGNLVEVPYYGWSDYGVKFREYHSCEREKALKNDYLDTFNYSNLSSRGFSDDEIEDIYRSIDKCMSGRSIDDFVFYQMYMKGRLYVPSEMDEEPDFESFYNVDQNSVVSDSWQFRLEYFKKFGSWPEDCDFVSREELFDYNDDNVYLYDEYIYKDKQFDDLVALYNKVRRRIAKARQQTYEFTKAMEDRMRKNGVKFPVKY